MLKSVGTPAPAPAPITQSAPTATQAVRWRASDELSEVFRLLGYVGVFVSVLLLVCTVMTRNAAQQTAPRVDPDKLVHTMAKAVGIPAVLFQKLIDHKDVSSEDWAAIS